VRDLIGWAATAVFVGSYFCARADALRRVQIAGALLWATYGVMARATPVVVANLLLVAVAMWTSSRSRVRPGSFPEMAKESPE
jgi:hypothetical protein